MEFIPKSFDPSQHSPLDLAFVGDTVFDLFVRSALVIEANRPVKQLQLEASKKVNAAAQAALAEKILPFLTEKEADVFRRGKNAHVHHVPKNMTLDDYRTATAFEALLGFLYLSGNTERIEELLNGIVD